MRVLTEKCDDYDYIEIILNDDDLETLYESFGISQDFINGLRKDVPLNVFIRQETIKEKVNNELDSY